MNRTKQNISWIFLIEPWAILVSWLFNFWKRSFQGYGKLFGFQALNYLLCPITMMHIDINYCYPPKKIYLVLCLLNFLFKVIFEVCRCYSDIVYKTKSVGKLILITHGFDIMVTKSVSELIEFFTL